MSKLRVGSLEALDSGNVFEVDKLGYTFEYAAGLVISSYSQFVKDGDLLYRVNGNIPLPYTTTGLGMPEDDAFNSGEGGSSDEGGAPISNPNFQGVVKINDVPLGSAATVNTGNEVGQINLVGDVASYCLDIDDAAQRGRWYVNGDTVGVKPTALGIVDTYGQTDDTINQDYVESVDTPTTDVMRRFFRSKIGSSDWSSWTEYTNSANSVNDTVTITREGNQVTKITEDGVDTDITYNPDGTVNTVTYPNGTKMRTETYTYLAGQVTGVTASEV